MKSNHTQGEWKKRKVNSYGKEWYEIHWSKDGECVAEVVHNEADADLFAAAPSMLEALKGLIKRIDESGIYQATQECFAAKEAISKAEGNI